MNTCPEGVSIPPDSQWTELRKVPSPATVCPTCGSSQTQPTSQKKTSVEREKELYMRGYMDALNGRPSRTWKSRTRTGPDESGFSNYTNYDSI